MAAMALSQRLLGRVAALMFIATGITNLFLFDIPGQPGGNQAAMIATHVTVIVLGAVFALLPWHRWRREALLVIGVVALAITGFGNWAMSPTNDTYAMFFVVIAAWIGVSFRSGTSLAFGPLVAASYFTPKLLHHVPFSQYWGWMALTVGTCVIMGEALAWLARQLRLAENADVRRLQDMQRLVAASEELARGLDGSRAVQTVGDLGALLLRARSGRVVYAHGWAPGLPGDELVDETLGGTRSAWNLRCDALCVPLVGTSGLIGALELTGIHATDLAYTADLARAFATQAALAFERLWATESLIDQSLQDELTGLGNRRRASAELSRLVPSDAVVMLDLDHFKRVNDEFGHSTGDDVLRSLGAFLRERVRDGDTCARFGGEEFLLVLRQGGSRAREIVDRLREDWNASLPLTTFSAGIAVHGAGQPPGTTLRLADAALYDAKNMGRDRVVEHDGMLRV